VQLSAEIRWFWEGAGLPGLKEWFVSAQFHDCAAGGGNLRTDAYLSDPQQTELGIKLRGNQTEVKGLVAIVAEGPGHPFLGQVEIWTKWSSKALSLGGARLILVNKRRWLRKFDCANSPFEEIALNVQELRVDGGCLPNEGCNVEYTEISVAAGQPWVTFGFEAFGTLDTVTDYLRQAMARVSLRHPPMPVDGWNASYPRWLQRVSAPS